MRTIADGGVGRNNRAFDVGSEPVRKLVPKLVEPVALHRTRRYWGNETWPLPIPRKHKAE